jgi:ferrous iron transport protein B
VAADIEARYAPQLVSLSGPDKDQLTATQDAEIQSAYLRQSWLGRAGRLVEPVVAPLGWDWRIGMAVLASFPAREVVVATLGVIFGVGDGADQDSDVLKSRLVEARHPDGRPLFTLPVALSIMVFFALCAQCAATLAVIRRETNSWFWPTLAFAYMTALAWIGAFLCYHGAGWFLG